MFIFVYAFHLLQILSKEVRGVKGFLFFDCMNVFIKMKVNKQIVGKKKKKKEVARMSVKPANQSTGGKRIISIKEKISNILWTVLDL